jgi:hypothetical protein
VPARFGAVLFGDDDPGCAAQRSRDEVARALQPPIFTFARREQARSLGPPLTRKLAPAHSGERLPAPTRRSVSGRRFPVSDTGPGSDTGPDAT